MNIKYQEHISRLIVLYVQGILDKEGQEELEAWRMASPLHEKIFRKMVFSSHFEDSVKQFVKSKAETETEWQLIRSRMGIVERRIWKKALRYAALWVLPLLVGGGMLYMLNRFNKEVEPVQVTFAPGSSHAILELADGTYVDLSGVPEGEAKQGNSWQVHSDSLKYQAAELQGKEEYHTLKVPRGGEYTVILPDGSKVFLNAESKLKYPIHFAGEYRKVKLEGEAYFEVKNDPSKPFIIEVDEMQVKVLGTSFGVRSYAGEEKVLTTLVSGKVNVRASNKEFELHPSEQAVYDKHSQSVKVIPVDSELFVGWKDGRLVFDNCPLEKILEDLGRWYSFEVFYSNQAAKEISFSLNIKKHEKVAQVLELLRSTGKIQFEISKNAIIVK